MRHPDGRYGTHEQIAAEARQEADQHEQAASEAAAAARDHSVKANVADYNGDRRTAVEHQSMAVKLRAVARGHRDLATGQRRLALHHEAKIAAPAVAKRGEPENTMVTPLSRNGFFANFGVKVA